MKRISCTQMTARLSIVGVLLLSGCATKPQPLYYWGDYQPQVYGHFTKDKSPEEQIAGLEAGLQIARANGKPVAPGYLAHLGILHAQSERQDQMRTYFEAEKTQYPESTAYIDFLLRKFKQPQ
ncbi:DUF4810 domain-containing protein [Zoogloea oleivorans]|uniref:DUF4810 domain-containing protein n=1 Tax=Zoogloea oleivorans TaxID=1552750 RepID=A0A6C2D2V7_9RHOO|nr:DUF4810 domain-containing protein [Zoogloea oleivorans]TYC60780.1 DUF4810 domain-containing protein [Zoogloea oleivorans]